MHGIPESSQLGNFSRNFVEISNKVAKWFSFHLIESMWSGSSTFDDEPPQYLAINDWFDTIFESLMTDCHGLILKNLVYVFQVISHVTCWLMGIGLGGSTNTIIAPPTGFTPYIEVFCSMCSNPGSTCRNWGACRKDWHCRYCRFCRRWCIANCS